MNVLNFLKELKRNDIDVSLVDDELEISYDSEQLPEAYLLSIKDRKTEIIHFLKHFRGSAQAHIDPLPVLPDYAVSSAQKRLWVLSQMEESSIAYNMPRAYSFEGTFNKDALKSSFARLIERHEISRTLFRENDQGELRQYILQPHEAGFDLEMVDLRSLADNKEQLAIEINRVAHTFFDLKKGPLLKAALIQTGDELFTLALCMHHITTDAWSMSVMLKELLTIYTALSGNTHAELAPLRIQYKDYAAWEQNQLKGDTYSTHEAYWLQQFQGDLPVLDLKADRMRPVVKTYNGGLLHFVIEEDTAHHLKQFVQNSGGTLFIGLLAAVNALLYRYTGQTDQIIGSPVAGRDHADLEDQIGFYVNTLALRSRFSEADSFRTLMESVKSVTLRAYEHQIYPFDELVAKLDLKRDMSRSALFDVMVALQNADVKESANIKKFGGIDIKGYESGEHSVSKFDLIFNFVELDTKRLGFSIEYNSDLYDAATIENTGRHLIQLIKALLLSPDTAICKLTYISKPEEQHLTGIANTIRPPYPSDETIKGLFEEQVGKTPQATALVFQDKVWSYAALNQYANRLSDYLKKEYSVQPGDYAGIMLNRGEALILSILSILKAGCAYIPVDPEFPEERIAYIRKDSQWKVLIDDDFLSRFSEISEHYNPENAASSITAASPAYILYTSGSTGTPKGVIVSHKNVIRLVKADNYAKLKADDVILSTGAISFDATTFEYWGALLNGGRLIVCPQGTLLDPALLEEEIVKHKVTTIFFTSGWFNQLVDTNIRVFKTLRTLLTGGDMVSIAHVHHLKKTYPALNILHVYGPTENTTFSTCYPVDAITPVIPIGKPISNSSAYILDNYQQLVPVGVVGEICLGGDGVAIGYLNNDEATREKFIPNPYQANDRLYRSGDLGRWLPDGNIEFIGRKDDQIKIRGYRIELGEIENALRGCAGVEKSLVMAKPNTHGEKTLVCYVAGRQDLTAGDLKAYLGNRLPSYMIPEYFVVLEDFPLSSTGKTDRSRLPDPKEFLIEHTTLYAEPVNSDQQTLHRIWKEVLDRERISIKDSFFEIGGQSIKAIRLINKIASEFGVKLEMRELFMTPVLEDQATLIRQKNNVITEIKATTEQEDYPLSSSQKRLWVLSHMEQGNVAYNIPGVYIFEGSLNKPALEKSFIALINRHEALRTLFVENEEEGARQLITPLITQFSIPVVSVAKTEKQQAEVKTLVEKEISLPFDLSKGPLIRARLIQLQDDRFVFVYVIHHIVSDGWSVNVMIKELLGFYQNVVNNRQDETPALRIHYKDYAVWEQQQLNDEQLEKHRAYWLNQFEGTIPLLELPGDYPRPAVKTYNGALIHKTIDRSVASGFRALLQKEESTVFMGLLAAINVLLYRYSDQADIVIGSPVAGRNHIDLENQIGFYVNTLALRNRFKAGDTYHSLLQQVKTQVLQAYEHQIYPFDRLVDELQLKRDMGRSALFDVMVVLHNKEAGKQESVFETGQLQVSLYADATHVASKFDLTFNFIEENDNLHFNIEYNTDLFHAATIEQYMADFETLLSSLTSFPLRALNTLSYVNADSLKQIGECLDNSGVNYPKTKTIVSLFEEQVSVWPSLIALKHGENTLTYDALNALSNQLAHYLKQSYDVKPEDRIGIKLSRSEWQVITILGILKAGAAYVPIDPEYPAERIEYMIADSCCKVVIDQQELDRFIHKATDYSNQNPDSGVQPESLAYVIYTSGTTGRPKGVMVEHKNVVRLFVNDQSLFDFNSSDVWTLFHSYCFDFSVWEIFGALLFGGKLIVVPSLVAKDPESFLNLLVQNQVTVLNQTPTAFANLQTQVINSKSPQLDIRYVIFGGEALFPGILKPWSLSYPGCRLINMYGITETTVHVTYKEIGLNEIENNKSNIGVPIPTLSCYILDEFMQPRSIGVPGELYVGGDGVVRGYLNRDELTRERFIPNPFKEGERLYKTGDKAKLLHHGELEYLGRLDNQVKIRGYRVELGEIESAILQFPEIQSVVVVLKQMSGHAPDLIAYFVSSQKGGANHLPDYLRAKLPAYMLPSYYVEIETLPLNSNGKIDKQALPDPTGIALSLGKEYEAPVNAIEEKVVEVWAEILRKDHTEISTKDNFFGLGGDSMKAIQVIAKLRKALSVDIDIITLYNAQTLREFSAIIKEKEPGIFKSIASAVTELEEVRQDILKKDSDKLPAGWVDIYPLTQIEQGMIYSSILRPSEPVYYDQFNYFVKINDHDRLLESVSVLVSRHDILRTRYYMKTFEQSVKVVMEHVEIPVFYDDISEKTQKEKEACINEFLVEDGKKRFEFEGDILWRLNFIKIGPDDYYVVWSVHHAILDGWSVSVFITELSKLLSGDNSISRKAPANTYKDYCAILLSRQVLPDTKQYWETSLRGYSRNKLPFNYKGVKVSNLPGTKSLKKVLNPDLIRDVNKAVEEYHVSYKAVCLAAHVYLMHVLCSEPTVVTGIVTHNRPEIEDAELILGCFLNTIPVSIDLKGIKTGKDLILQVNDFLMTSKQHEIHLSEIASTIGDKPLTGNPIFDTLFNFTDFHSYTGLEGNDVLVSVDDLLLRNQIIGANEMTNTHFDVEVDKTLNSFSVKIKYLCSHFHEQDIAYALELYENTLGMIVSEDIKALNTSHLLSETEKKDLILTFNSTVQPYSKSKTIHQLFEEQVHKTPVNIALKQGHRELSYSRLNQLANQLAFHLIEKGVQQGENIGLITDRNFEMIIGMFAILKAGAAYVPVDPEYPENRKAYILQNSGISKVVCDSVNRLPESLHTIQQFSIHDDVLAGYPDTNPALNIDSVQLAYTIYTSGSTGQPKGVMIEHHAAVNLIEWVNSTFDVGADDRLLFITSMCFDLSVYDIFGILASGGTLVIVKQEEVQDVKQLKRLLTEEKITFWDSVPTTMNYLVEELENYSQQQLRLVFLSGDWIPVQLPDKIKQHFPHAQVISLGGATEGTVWSNYYPVNTVEESWTSIPYGVPITNNFFYVLDEDFGLVPRGVVGELFIGGTGVARGYANDSEKTSYSFVADPYRKELGGRMYRTGDLGKMMPDGNLEFLGRKDNQVKIRGYRVELGEIESCLNKHERIREAVVNVITDSNNIRQLCAYYVLKSDLAIEEMKDYLRESLPSYMIPSYYLKLEALPLNSNGKIDRKKLPLPSGEQIALTHYKSPETQLEITLVDIWKSILKLTTIGATDNVFDLGAHSLNVAAFINRVHRRLNVSISLQQVFAEPTVSRQAKIIERADELLFHKIPVLPSKQIYKLSSSQKRLWVLSQFKEANVAYNIYNVYRFDQSLDVKALEKSFSCLIARHEVLRTQFTQNAEGIVSQIIRPVEQVKFVISYEEISHEAAEDRAVQELVEKHIYAPFNLEEAPLLRALLVKQHDGSFVFAYTMHHIISDGWSLKLILNELLAIYSAYIKQEQPSLAPLRIHYKDFAAWEQAQLTTPVSVGHESYWLDQFAGELPVLELKGDWIRPAVKTYNGSMVHLAISQETSAGFKQLIQSQGATLFMGLLATVNTLLYKYTHQNDQIIGSPVSGRDHVDLEDQIGFYVNTLALRSRFEGADSYQSLLENIKTLTLNAYEHQLYPFDELVDKLSLKRDTSRSALFDIMIVLQNTDLVRQNHTEDPAARQVSIEGYGSDIHLASKFDLTFNFIELGDSLHLSLEYNTDLYSRDTASRLVKHFETLIHSILADPHTSLDKLGYITAAEKTQLLDEFNHTAGLFPKGHTVVSLFEEQVKQVPENLALAFKEKEYSYAQLNDLSNRFANYLKQQHHIQKSDLIGIKLERSEWVVVVIMGILKAGAVYVPVDPGYSADKINYIISDAQLRLVIDEDTRRQFTESQAHHETELTPVSLAETDPAYVIYTSGTTDKPRGVLVSHGSLYNYLSWASGYYFTQPAEGNFGLFSSLSFDLTVTSLFLPLIRGRFLELFDPGMDVSETLVQYLTSPRKPDTIKLTPSHLRLFDGINVEDTAVRKVIVGGETLYPHHINIIKSIHSDMEIYNEYGPTEATVGCVVEKVSGEPVLIGKPIANTEIFILDGQLQPLAIGIIGEMYISGKCLALGYLNKPELTAAKFIEHPFRKGEKLYKTGDLGRWQSDGRIEYLGRTDDEVKIRGHRVLLSEIENSLLNHEQISSAIVVVYADHTGEQELVAYMVCEKPLPVPELRAYLTEKLPAFMIPSYFAEIEKMPLTVNGKINKKALPPSHALSSGKEQEFVAPRNQLEAALTPIWQLVLKKQRIGIDDNFFELGGHSINAINLINRIHKEIGVRLEINSMFRYATIRDQAAFISLENPAAYESIPNAPVQESYELSASQQRLWLIQKINPAATTYNMNGKVDMGPELDVVLYKEALKGLIQRHEVLRTVFVEKDGIPFQKIMDQVDVSLEMRTIDSSDDNRIIHQLKELETAVFNHVFDLAVWPLMKVILVKHARGYRLIYSMHHIISDGWSMEVFEKDLHAMYHSRITGSHAGLPELAIQYKDFAHWQNRLLKNSASGRHEDYWMTKLGGDLPQLRLPVDGDSNNVANAETGIYNTFIDNTVFQKIRQLSVEQRMSSFALYTACFKVLLNGLSGQKDLIIGTPAVNRSREEVQDLIGFFLNTLMLRDQLDPDKRFIDFLQQVNKTVMDGLEHQAYPFEKLLEKLNIPRDFNQFPVSPVFLNLLNFNLKNEDSITDFTSGHALAPGDGKVDLECYFKEFVNGVSITCSYKTRLFRKETIEYWIESFKRIISEVVLNPEIQIREIDYFESRQPATPAPVPTDTFSYFEEKDIVQSIVSRFEEQVEKHPEATAVFQNGTAISYRALNEQANALAQKITALTDLRGQNIALLLDHGFSGITGMLGVLKSGNVYVPLDPEYPEDRLSYMLKDSGCGIILVDTSTEKLASDLLNSGQLSCINITGLAPQAMNPGIAIAPDSKAYILYTSGSTGEPKGVVQAHKNVLHFIRVYTNNLHLHNADRISLLPTYSFDSSVMDIYGALLNGAALYIYNLKKEGIENLASWILANKVSIIHTVPTIYRYFVNTLSGTVFKSVRLVVLGGEAVYINDFEQFKKHFAPGSLLINGYGPTESTITLQKFLDHDTVLSGRNVPIGRQVADTNVWLITKENKEARVYEEGEIVYESDYLAVEYFNKPEETGAVFTKNPITGKNRVYRSRDLGRRLPDGEIEFLGRMDGQVKFNGVRIELSEIEFHLLKIEAVEEAIVLLKWMNEKPVLVAYIKVNEQIPENTIKQKLSQTLPLYMVPSLYLFMDTFPLTPTGKISRLSLPEPPVPEVAAMMYVAPQTEHEKRMTQLWHEVLGIEPEKIGVDNNFFLLGGHSLKAIALISRIGKEFGVEIKPVVFFNSPTIRELCMEIESIEWVNNDRSKSGELNNDVEKFSIDD